MSHSPTEEARAWDFGMVDQDLIAFPICQAAQETYWSRGQLQSGISYWHERNCVQWVPQDFINYFRVAAFRSTHPARSSTKRVTEGSETSIAWNATFSSRAGVVENALQDRITIRRTSDGHRYTWKFAPDQNLAVTAGQVDQIIASAVLPTRIDELVCPRTTTNEHMSQLLRSRERTLRFTGVKLARLRGDASFQGAVEAMGGDSEEDVYIRLEAVSYLASVCGRSAS